MKPVFKATSLKDTGYSRKVGSDESHLKLNIITKDGKTKFDGIGFGLGEWHEKIKDGDLFSIVFTIDENHWNGNTTLQLNVKDIKLDD
jgi:single-stranded-DNA-specific exonuclease